MRSLVRAVFLMFAFAACTTPATRQESQTGDVAGEIRALLDAQVDAWNRRDLEGFMEGYWRSPDLTFYSNGSRTSGWDATIERYRQRYQGEGREMGQLSFNALQIEMLGPDGAFVRGEYHLKTSEGESGGIFTLVLKRFPNGWKIVHDHTGSE